MLRGEGFEEICWEGGGCESRNLTVCLRTIAESWAMESRVPTSISLERKQVMVNKPPNEKTIVRLTSCSDLVVVVNDAALFRSI